MTKPIDDIALRYALRLNTIIRDMRRDLTDEAFGITIKYICERNGFWIGPSQLNPVPDPCRRQPLKIEMKQQQEQAK